MLEGERAAALLGVKEAALQNHPVVRAASDVLGLDRERGLEIRQVVVNQNAPLSVGLLFHGFGMKHAGPHPRWNLLPGKGRAFLVRGDQIVVVELASHLGHPVLVDQMRLRNAEPRGEGRFDFAAGELGPEPFRATGVHGA